MSAAVQAPVRPELANARLGFGRILRSEWVKISTLRSTWWCLGILAALTAVTPFLIALLIGRPWDGMPTSVDEGYYNWMNATTISVIFTVLVAAVLGCLVITGEYGTGMIRSTMTAVPKRLSALIAKMLVIGLAVFLTGLIALGVGAVLSGLVFSGNGYEIDPTEGRVYTVILAAAGYPALIAVFSTGIGTMLRSSAGAIAAVLGLLMVLPGIFPVVGALTEQEWWFDVANFLPSNLGSVMYTPRLSDAGSADLLMMPGTITLDPTQATLALLAWVAAAVIGACLTVKSRDV